MGAGLHILKTCDGEGVIHRKYENDGSPIRPGSNWANDVDVGCEALQEGVKAAVATANRGGVKISDEVLLDNDLLQHARSGNVRGLNEALEKGAWPETRRPLVMKPQKLLSSEVKKESPEEGMTPLMFASQFGSVSCVERLIRADADVDAVEEDGWTSLHFAAKEGHLEVCEALIQAKCNPAAQNGEEMTALQIAEETDKEFAKQLRKVLSKRGYDGGA